MKKSYKNVNDHLNESFDTPPPSKWLDEHFPDRWIGRRGFVEWPARSPDLTPLDFFLWGVLKNQVFSDKPKTLNDLKGKL